MIRIPKQFHLVPKGGVGVVKRRGTQFASSSAAGANGEKGSTLTKESTGASSTSSSSPAGATNYIAGRKSPTANADEIRRFDSLASEWWDPSGPLGALHDFNPTRISFITENVINGRGGGRTCGGRRHDGSFMALDGLSVLDVGCGGGILSQEIAKAGAASVTAIDASTEAILVANKWKERMMSRGGGGDSSDAARRVQFRNCEVSELAGEGKKFDLVVASEVIEHVDLVEEFFEDCSKCVKDNGVFVVTTINKTWEAYLLAIVAAENIFKVLPKGLHQYEKFVEPEKLNTLASLNGMSHLETRGVLYLPGIRKFVPDPFCRIQYLSAFKKRHVD